MDDQFRDGVFHVPANPSGPILAELAEPQRAEYQRRRHVLLPVLLFVATCWTTYSVGSEEFHNTVRGLMYAVAVMTILLVHELGHFIQALRYGVPASLPFFIPVPLRPIGTMGAVIAMSGNMGNRKSLFDIGISGPIAGLIPALICCVVGLKWSTISDVLPPGETLIGTPMLFRYLIGLYFQTLGPGQSIDIHPIAFAGWVGVFITSVNLFPIGQLDGGHVLYALLREKAHVVATLVLSVAILAVLWTQSMQWAVMLFLLVLIGPKHPPTANDDVPLGTGRTILGWLTLLFPIIGFTPTPFGGM